VHATIVPEFADFTAPLDIVRFPDTDERKGRRLSDFFSWCAELPQQSLLSFLLSSEIQDLMFFP